jgi:diguanylate cyclase (GGDEF)-like protein
MALGVDDDGHPDPVRPGVSGTVVHALLAHVRHEAGDAGVAQALALAAEERPFPALGATSTWTALPDAAALFAAGALVTGDGAIGLHVGEELLWAGDDPSAGRIASLGSPEVAARHIGALIEQFEGATEALALEVGPGHALVQVSSDGHERQAHLCDLTRGLLSQLPVPFGGRPAHVTEHECAARGGRFCRYILEWEPVANLREATATGAAVDRGVPGIGPEDGETTDTTGGRPGTPASGRDTGVGTVRRDSDGRPLAGGRSDDATGAAVRSDQDDPFEDSFEDDPFEDSFEDDPFEDDSFEDDAPFGRDERSPLGSGGGWSAGRRTAVDGLRDELEARRGGTAVGGTAVGGMAVGGLAVGDTQAALGAMGVTGDEADETRFLSEQLRATRAALAEALANATRLEAVVATGSRENDERARQREEEAARSGADAARFERLLEDAAASTLALLDRDIEHVVHHLAECADRVLGAERYLLTVRPGAGLPLEFHHRGLAPGKAQALAAELWGGTTDAVDESLGTSETGVTSDARLVVDIVTPLRRYGRIAEYFGPEASDTATEERILRLFARYAGNVLDVCTVLSDARRSNSTARTLLSFGEQLSGLTNLAQALQILADTVPVVTGCGQSTVYLWDRERSRLVLGAFTAGRTPPDADLGPIVPHWSTSSSATHIHVGHPPDGVEADALSVEADNPLIQRMIGGHEVMVLDASVVEDPQLRALMEASGVPASLVAPLFAAGEFLGVIAANFPPDTAPGAIHDPDLHERLCGLADQAATAIQNLELLEKVSHMAWHDSLTGLPNRRLFEDRVEQELVRSRRVGEPVCMFFVDLDNFKTVNDTFGHATGDLLIQQVGQRLVETVRSQDTVARVGGDEFAILLPGLVDQLSINQLAERTLDAMHTPFEIFGDEVITSASVGIAIAPEHGDSYDDLLNRADEAMYRAKDLGRDAFEMFHNTPDPVHPGRRALDDRQLYNDLLAALDGNQFFLLYQPYIDLRTAQIVGVEALIRWDHPTLGILEPPHFIHMAERSDLIVSLDNWVLWQACRQLRTWRDHGLDPLRLSVNLASRDLANPDFFHSVQRTLRDTGVDPTFLELDITDRVVLDRSGPATENIEQLRRLGVRFTVDDFGQGNSSLDRIGAFPVSTLKIDQSFVQVLGPTDEESSLVSAIIGMAGRLGLSCVAEGVETLLQSRVLLQRGCTTAQGYYFSPPLPPEGIEEMLVNLAPAEVPESFGEPSNGNIPPEQPNA